jgi:hypothetical protein
VDKFVTNASRRFVTAVENSLTITSEDQGIILELFDISRSPHVTDVSKMTSSLWMAGAQPDPRAAEPPQC